MSITKTTTTRSCITAHDVHNTIDQICAGKNWTDRHKVGGAPAVQGAHAAVLPPERENWGNGDLAVAPNQGPPHGQHRGPPPGGPPVIGVNVHAAGVAQGGANAPNGANPDQNDCAVAPNGAPPLGIIRDTQRRVPALDDAEPRGAGTGWAVNCAPHVANVALGSRAGAPNRDHPP